MHNNSHPKLKDNIARLPFQMTTYLQYKQCVVTREIDNVVGHNAGKESVVLKLVEK